VLQNNSGHDRQNGPALKAAKKVCLYPLHLIGKAGAGLWRYRSERFPGPTTSVRCLKIGPHRDNHFDGKAQFFGHNVNRLRLGVLTLDQWSIERSLLNGER
jgi:hypothetical protein